MRLPRKLALLALLFAASGCRRTYVVPQTPMPPNTVLLSQMMQQLSAQPGFTNKLLDQLDKGGRSGPALLTPKLIDELRKRILGSDWQGLDRFPGWTMRAINPTVRVIGHVAGKDQKLEDASAVTPARHSPPPRPAVSRPRPLRPRQVRNRLARPILHPPTLLHRRPRHLARRGRHPWRRPQRPRPRSTPNPSASPTSSTASPPTNLPTRKPSPSPPATTPPPRPSNFSPALADEGYTITVDDARYFANFAHLHFNGEDVMAPFYIDSGIIVPNSGGRHLLVPASHAEYEWHIHPSNSSAPHINADISYYFGIDGKAEWRTMDTLDQPWSSRRNAHEYTGAQAVEVTRLVGLMTVRLPTPARRTPHPSFGGYYALGVCQDGVSAIERKLTGSVTLFPNTADAAFFNDPPRRGDQHPHRRHPQGPRRHAPRPPRASSGLCLSLPQPTEASPSLPSPFPASPTTSTSPTSPGAMEI